MLVCWLSTVSARYLNYYRYLNDVLSKKITAILNMTVIDVGYSISFNFAVK